MNDAFFAAADLFHRSGYVQESICLFFLLLRFVLANGTIGSAKRYDDGEENCFAACWLFPRSVPMMLRRISAG